MSDSGLRNRIFLQISVALLWALAAGTSSLSVEDPDGMLLRVGMVLVTVGASMWLPPAIAIGLVPAVWFGPSFARAQLSDYLLYQDVMWIELPALLCLSVASAATRRQLAAIEKHDDALHAHIALRSEIDEATGVYQQRLLPDAIERELARSRRFGREFAVMLAGVEPMRAKFDYRGDDKWDAGLKATAAVLLNTRHHIDRVYRYGLRGFALVLPETGPKDISGLIRRLTRAARKSDPPEGEAGGPLPLHFGVTFFPQCATSVEDILRRAEVALRLAEKSPSRVQLDGAEAAEGPPPETFRRDGDDDEVEALAGQWLGAEAPEEENPALALPWMPQTSRPGGPPTAALQETAHPGRHHAADVEGTLADLAKRLDETLGLIRSMKLGAREAA